MSSDVRQPPIEVVVGAPLQIRERDGVTVVGIRTRDGWQVLKKISRDVGDG